MHSLVRAVLRSVFNETGHWALIGRDILSLISHLLELLLAGTTPARPSPGALNYSAGSS